MDSPWLEHARRSLSVEPTSRRQSVKIGSNSWRVDVARQESAEIVQVVQRGVAAQNGLRGSRNAVRLTFPVL